MKTAIKVLTRTDNSSKCGAGELCHDPQRVGCGNPGKDSVNCKKCLCLHCTWSKCRPPLPRGYAWAK
jgi:hypothetical protein